MNPLAPLGAHALSIVLSTVLLLAGFGLEVKPFFESARPKPAVLAARWCLWVGTAGLLLGVGTGFLNTGKSVMVDVVTTPLSEHRFLGIWTAAVFTVISVWRFLSGRRASALMALVWLSAFWILGAQIAAGIRLRGNGGF